MDKPNRQDVTKVLVVGGGLAGSEAAWRLAQSGFSVVLIDMKPEKFSPAHREPDLAELVCSNSLRSEDLLTGVGLLKWEMRFLGSLVLEAADKTRVPAGKALAVDRKLFARYITSKIETHPLISRKCYELTSLQDELLEQFSAIILAPGPLVSSSLAKELKDLSQGELYFYDAIAPIVSADSLDLSKMFWASRYAEGKKDYLNIPLTREDYLNFVNELKNAQKVIPKEFEKELHFEGCLPIEEMAKRGEMTLAFGPLKPVGLVDPKTQKQPFAVVQLRPENKAKTAFNLVGFQTKLTYPEQKRIFRMLPGLEQAEFLRLGSIHRNTFINAPRVLNSDLSLKVKPQIHLAGQITGVEGYVESAACGLMAGIIVSYKLQRKKFLPPPPETSLGALLHYLQIEQKNFQPSNIHFGLFPPLVKKLKKRERKQAYSKRAQQKFREWLEQIQ
ncbi:MAG: methylenetetrahydrofolate--tRNA-(uracil(54)-C(5))-methyltransferase (FADH(2)-oxidizing) TrmFO [Desulfonauticus sp.]|nr:methylenetetrahydrofolate--tRNA-(uracil(54)-C(5))-methyltransferase (FADH(2)-oxidizing) TrmFO [Desulfonauticus sp.]